MSDAEYDRAMEWVDSIDPADVKPVDDATRERLRKMTIDLDLIDEHAREGQ